MRPGPASAAAAATGRPAFLAESWVHFQCAKSPNPCHSPHAANPASNPCHRPIATIVTAWQPKTAAASGSFGIRRRRYSSQRKENVVAHPARQRHVPALPEAGEIALQVGKIEVFRDREADELSAVADRDVGIAREIEEELKAENVEGSPHPRSRQARVGEVQGQAAEKVGDRELLEDSDEHAPAALRDLAELRLPILLVAAGSEGSGRSVPR